MKFPALLATLLGCCVWTASAPAQFLEYYAPTTPPNLGIPDGSSVGLISTISVPYSSILSLTSVELTLQIDGGFNGDLYAYLVHTLPNGMSAGFVTLLNRSGLTASDPLGYGDSGFQITFSDLGVGDIHLYQNFPGGTPVPGSPLTGVWQPDGRTASPFAVTDASPRTSSFADFQGYNAAGDWTLFLADVAPVDSATFVTWGLTLRGVPEPSTVLAGVFAAAAALAAWRRRSLAGR